MRLSTETGNADVEYLSDGNDRNADKKLVADSELERQAALKRVSLQRQRHGFTNDAKELNVQAILNGRVVQRASS